MLTPTKAHTGQKNLFYSELLHQVDHNDPLIHLADKINWQVFENSFAKHYCHNNGRPDRPIRLMPRFVVIKTIRKLCR